MCNILIGMISLVLLFNGFVLEKFCFSFADCQYHSKMLVQKIERSPLKCILMWCNWMLLMFFIQITVFNFMFKDFTTILRSIFSSSCSLYISCSLVFFLQICSSVQFIPWRPWTGLCHCLPFPCFVWLTLVAPF